MREIENKIADALHEYHELATEGLYGRIWKWWGIGFLWLVIWLGSIMLAAVPVSRLYFTAKIHEYEAIQTTIEMGRITHHDDSELRGILTEVANWNGWLAFYKTWNKVPIIDYYIPDNIENLEEMK